MKLGILSDTHNNLDNTRRALALLDAQGVSRLIHCGDLTSGKIVELLAGREVAFVYGNWDRPSELAPIIESQPGMTIGDTYTGEFDDLRVAAYHGHVLPILSDLILCTLYDVVFFGHSHRRSDDWVGGTRVVNPGALGGMRHQPRSFCILDSSNGELSFVELEET